MQKLHIEKTFQTPAVLLDPEKNQFEISGNSLPNNPHRFYIPILNWMDEYVTKSNPESVFVLRLSHQNSSTKKMLHELMKSLELIHRSGKKISVDWHYASDDEDLMNAGLEISKNFPFAVNCIPVQVMA
jgi:hypothetical protein